MRSRLRIIMIHCTGAGGQSQLFFPFRILNLLKLSFLSQTIFFLFCPDRFLSFRSLVSFCALGPFFTRSRDGKQIIAFFRRQQFFHFQFFFLFLFYNVQTNADKEPTSGCLCLHGMIFCHVNLLKVFMNNEILLSAVNHLLLFLLDRN